MAEEIPILTTSMRVEAAGGAPLLTLRPAESRDEGLLAQIFAESHCAGFELMGLAPAALAGLVGMQFQARQAQYRAVPGATEYLIARVGPGAEVLGSCWLSDTAEQLRVLDIAVLAEHRRRGVARAVLSALCDRAATAGKPVALSVWHDNGPARQLYQSLDFVPDPAIGADEPGDRGNGYLELRHCATDPRPVAPRSRAGAR